jgi:hypothetical protein
MAFGGSHEDANGTRAGWIIDAARTGLPLEAWCRWSTISSKAIPCAHQRIAFLQLDFAAYDGSGQRIIVTARAFAWPVVTGNADALEDAALRLAVLLGCFDAEHAARRVFDAAGTLIFDAWIWVTRLSRQPGSGYREAFVFSQLLTRNAVYTTGAEFRTWIIRHAGNARTLPNAHHLFTFKYEEIGNASIVGAAGAVTMVDGITVSAEALPDAVD